jgi:hypothetical protein
VLSAIVLLTELRESHPLQSASYMQQSSIIPVAIYPELPLIEHVVQPVILNS